MSIWNNMLVGNGVGRVANSILLSTTPGGLLMCRFTVAINNRKKSQDGKYFETTTWLRCVAWERQAEIITKNVKKGDVICVYGKLETREWETRDGVVKTDLEMNVSDFTLVDNKFNSIPQSEVEKSDTNDKKGKKKEVNNTEKNDTEENIIEEVALDQDIPF